jgi:hypothetical protein
LRLSPPHGSSAPFRIWLGLDFCSSCDFRRTFLVRRNMVI